MFQAKKEYKLCCKRDYYGLKRTKKRCLMAKDEDVSKDHTRKQSSKMGKGKSLLNIAINNLRFP